MFTEVWKHTIGRIRDDFRGDLDGMSHHTELPCVKVSFFSGLTLAYLCFWQRMEKQECPANVDSIVLLRYSFLWLPAILQVIAVMGSFLSKYFLSK